MGDRTKAKDLFLDALDLPPGERRVFLRKACGDNDDLFERVQELLDAHRDADDYLARPPGDEVEIDVVPGDRIDAYLLLERLGEGGFGTVFLAEQERPVRRRVALKIVKLGMDTRAVIARFEMERQALALMDHTNIARVFDAGATESGRPYFVMELVDGQPITEYCNDAELGTGERLALFRTVCQAVQHAHQRGILHRDLKPSNLLIATVDGEPVPKIIDFGIAKALGARLSDESFLTRGGIFLGTPAYMSPEQAEGALDIDTRSDVYSLGVLLYELLSGAPPFDARELGMEAMRNAIRDQEPPRPSTRRRQLAEAHGNNGPRAGRPPTAALLAVPTELDWVVMRCLEKERARRYPAASDLAEDLDRFLSNLPVEAAPPSTWYRLRKLAKRHRTATLAASAVSIALLLGATGTILGLVQATHANERLELARAEAERQAEIAEAVNAFLTDDLLSSARPSAEEGRGRDATIVEVLERASGELLAKDASAFDDALVEAALHDSIGRTFELLGDYEAARTHLSRAVELRRAELGAHAAPTLESMSFLGRVLEQLTLWEESEALQREALDALRATLGEAHEDTLLASMRLGSLLSSMGRYPEATELLEETLATALRHRSDDALIVSDLRSRLGRLYTTGSRPDEAEDLFRAALETRREQLGDKAPPTLASRINLASFLFAQARPEEAAEILADVLPIQREVEGPLHANTLRTAFNLAECLRNLDRFDEADALVAEYEAGVEEVWGLGHPRALGWMSLRGRLAEERQNFDEAGRIYREAWEASRDHIGPEHPDTLQRLVDLGGIYLRAERYGEAEPIFRDVYEAHERTLGPLDRQTVWALKNHGWFYHYADEPETARPLLEEAVRRGVESLGDDDLLTMECKAALAAMEARVGELEAAEERMAEIASLEELGMGRAFSFWLTAAQYLAAGHRVAGDEESAQPWVELVESYGFSVPEEPESLED